MELSAKTIHTRGLILLSQYQAAGYASFSNSNLWSRQVFKKFHKVRMKDAGVPVHVQSTIAKWTSETTIEDVYWSAYAYY